jgi:hypothetical protein
MLKVFSSFWVTRRVWGEGEVWRVWGEGDNWEILAK